MTLWLTNQDRNRNQSDGTAEQHELKRPIGVAKRLHHGVHGAEQHQRGQFQVDAMQGGVFARGGQGAAFGLVRPVP